MLCCFCQRETNSHRVATNVQQIVGELIWAKQTLSVSIFISVFCFTLA